VKAYVDLIRLAMREQWYVGPVFRTRVAKFQDVAILMHCIKCFKA
jgi:hypothetical protein